MQPHAVALAASDGRLVVEIGSPTAPRTYAAASAR
jgi:hypothetical protein